MSSDAVTPPRRNPPVDLAAIEQPEPHAASNYTGRERDGDPYSVGTQPGQTVCPCGYHHLPIGAGICTSCGSRLWWRWDPDGRRWVPTFEQVITREQDRKELAHKFRRLAAELVNWRASDVPGP